MLGIVDHDVVVIGAGAAGLAAARSARRKGSVALIEVDRPGGECTFTGCVPSKTLLELAHCVAAVSKADRAGVEATVRVDISAVLTYVRSIVEEIATDESPERLRSEGIDLIEGSASFIDDRRIEVGGKSIAARYFVVATGTRPAIPPIPGLKESDPLTNETIFDIREAPSRLVVLGGGAVGCELAQGFARLGVPVSLVEAASRILGDEEPDASDVVAGALSNDGIEVVVGAKVSAAEKGLLRLEDGRELRGSHVLVAAGRIPQVEGLALERAGVELDEDGSIKIDARNRTTNARIYAVGDCASRLRFTHVADEQGRTSIADIYSRFPRKTDLGAIPWVTFTSPEVGRVGTTEAEAYEMYGDKARVAIMSIDKTDRGRISGHREGFVKLIGAPHPVTRSIGGGRLVGMTAVCERGGELVAEGALAMRSGTLAGRLAQTVHAYPTWSIAVRQAAAQWFTGLDRAARPSPGSGFRRSGS